MTARDEVIEVIRAFRWWNYGMDDVNPRSPYADWVPDLADEILAALGEYVGKNEGEA